MNKPKVEYRIAQPNPLFPPELTVLLRFAIYTKAMSCPVCKRKTKSHWTMLCPFKAATMGQLSLKLGDRIFQPGEAVCGNHPLQPIKAVAEMFCYPNGEWFSKLGSVFDEMVSSHENHP